MDVLEALENETLESHSSVFSVWSSIRFWRFDSRISHSSLHLVGNLFLWHKIINWQIRKNNCLGLHVRQIQIAYLI